MDIAPSGCVDDAPHPFDPPDAMSPDAMLDTEAWRTESPAIAVERLLRGLRAATRRVDDVEQEANRLRSNVAAWVESSPPAWGCLASVHEWLREGARPPHPRGGASP